MKGESLLRTKSNIDALKKDRDIRYRYNDAFFHEPLNTYRIETSRKGGVKRFFFNLQKILTVAGLCIKVVCKWNLM